MRLRPVSAAKHPGSDGECPAPTCHNPVKARLFAFPMGSAAQAGTATPGLANAARASASPASGARAGMAQGICVPGPIHSELLGKSCLFQRCIRGMARLATVIDREVNFGDGAEPYFMVALAGADK